MTEQSTKKRFLPLFLHNSGRSAMTCKYRCGHACSHQEPNRSENEYFGDVVAEAVSRRTLLKGGAAAALVLVAGRWVSPSEAQAALLDSAPEGSLTFKPVAPNEVDDVIVPNGYTYKITARWGDPLFPGAPEFDFENQTARAQARQFGYNCDYVTFIPLPDDGQGRTRGLLVVNHEYTDSELMFRSFDPKGMTPQDLERIQIELMAHGMSVVEVFRGQRFGAYKVRRSSLFNRRITAETPMRLTGPAAGHDWMKTSADPAGTRVLGTLNNCAGGTTPWGTVLSAEENFNQYFAHADLVTDEAKKAAYDRYGFPEGATDRGWERTEDRFDLSTEPNEGFRFGWVVEIDPNNPRFVPKKRTALGRMKHEGAETTLSKDGRAVSYMGDDERFEYVYKFVSSGRMMEGTGAAARRNNLSLLDDGTLYVAKFTGDSPSTEITGEGAMPSDGAFDGTGQWIPLVTGGQSFVPDMTAGDVLINTRAAADRMGATKMDRPEDMQRNHVTGRVYLALTNNTRRGVDTSPGVDEANPVKGNKHGHVIEMDEAGNDPAATTFVWSIFILAGDPEDPSTYYGGFDKSQVSAISAPDNLAFDEAGNLWIATDGHQLSHDGFFPTPVEGPERGHSKRFLSVPNGAEACGPEITPDQETIFCAVHHPGEVDGANPDNRASTWPDGGQPRPSVVSIYKDVPGSKRIGS